MRFVFVALTAALCLSLGLAGCNPSAQAPIQTSSSAPDSRLLLKEQPSDAKHVIDARKDAKDGDEIVVTGRIGGDVDPWVKGRAAFLIVDPSLVPCSEREGDSCPTPWDYCCDTDRLADAKATIKFVNEAGDTLPTDARQLLGVKELQYVTVRGQAKRDEAGNLTVLAKGIYVKP